MRHVSWLLACIVMIGVGLPTRAEEGGQVYLRLQVQDRSQLKALAEVGSIDRVEGGQVWLYTSPVGLERVINMGYVPERLPDPGLNPGARMDLAGRAASGQWDAYPTYAGYVQMMQSYAAAYPGICRLVEIADSTNTSRPHKLLALKISDSPDFEEDEPEVFLTSTMHGDETVGFVTLLHLADELLTHYDPASSDPVDEEITALVEGLEIWINPASNPDGTYYSSDTSVSGAIRSLTTSTGANSYVDPNRNFPDPEDGDHPDGNTWWGETQAMIALAEAHSFVLSTNLHGGTEVVNYPWDTWPRLHPDDSWYQVLSHAYADQAQADGPSGYMSGFDDGTTNGYDWYEVNGGRQDLMNYWYGCREVTIEVSSTKNPAASSLPTFWTANRQALLNYMATALTGVRGLVRDPGGTPLAATIEIPGHDADGSVVYTDPDVGDYHRMLLPGTYDLRFSAPGHVAQDVTGVVVSSGDATRLDVVLQPSVPVDVSGIVTTPDLKAALAGATVELVGSGIAPITTAGDGTYQLTGVPSDTYTFRVSRDGYETVQADRQVSLATAVHDFVLAPINVSLTTDLEADNGSLVSAGGWEWGAPSGTGSPGAHSGSNVWATNLDGQYPSGISWQLSLEDVAVPVSSPRLVFWHAYAIESGWDGGNVEASTNGTAWTLLQPDGGYPDDTVDALGDQPGFTGTSGGWQEVSFDLSAWAGQTVDLRWTFASDNTQVDVGWYLDDISVVGVGYRADFTASEVVVSVGEQVQLLDRSSGPVQSWSWDLGDTTTSTEADPTHSYGAVGDYTVSLTVTYPAGVGSGSDTRTRPAYIHVVGGDTIFVNGFEDGTCTAWSAQVPAP